MKEKKKFFQDRLAMKLLIIAILILVAVPVIRTGVFRKPMRALPGNVTAVEKSGGEEAEPAVTPEVEEPSVTEAASEIEASPVTEVASEVGMSPVFEYGYSPDDRWVERECAFRIMTENSGMIYLDVYYPFEIDGVRKGIIAVNGQEEQSFELTGENTVIGIQGTPDAVNEVQIVSDFAKSPGEDGADQRSLAFVLTDVRLNDSEAEESKNNAD